MTRHILYVTFDGLLEPLGYSQVVRYVLELSGRNGLRYTIASLEKEGDLADTARLSRLRKQLEDRGVRWVYHPYTQGGVLAGATRNMASMNALVEETIAGGIVDLIHARSYLSALVAYKAKRAHRTPYLFDIRGYWIDERTEQGRWFTNPLLYEGAKSMERKLFESADGVISLSRIAAEDIRGGRMGRWEAHKPIALIPTCVDYDEFAIGRPPRPGIVPDPIAARLKDKLVIGFVGSPGPVYCVEEMMRIFSLVRARRPDAHLLALTGLPKMLEDIALRARIPAEAFTLARAPHDEIADWYAYMDWGMMLRRRSFANRASMPTKMAEFFARGVRPLAYGCNDEVCEWVAHAGSGHVLNALGDEDLREAARIIAGSTPDPQALATARWRTQGHFDLKSGITRCAAIIDEILAPSTQKLRVLFLTEGQSVPASRFRVEQLVPHLEKRGVACTVRAAYDGHYNQIARIPFVNKAYKLLWSLKRVPAALDAGDFDLLFIQRPALPFSAWPEKFATHRNPRAIFDVDDAIFMRTDGTIDPRAYKTFEQAIESCAHVICGNEFLATHARPHGPTTVIPTVIDTARYVPTPRSGDREEVVIGWMGTASNFPCLDIAVPALLNILERYPNARLRIVSNAIFDRLTDVGRVEQIPWSAPEEIPLLQSFDIGLMPLPNIKIVQGKCGFKMIQYMAVGIPIIASALGANKTIFAGSQAGFLIDEKEPHRDRIGEPIRWEEALSRLIEQPELRRKMGRRGRRHVVEHYSIDAVIDTYVALFKRLRGEVLPIAEIPSSKEEQPTPEEALPAFSVRALLNLLAFSK